MESNLIQSGHRQTELTQSDLIERYLIERDLIEADPDTRGTHRKSTLETAAGLTMPP